MERFVNITRRKSAVSVANLLLVQLPVSLMLP
jgi:hypothetical protein